MDTRQIEYILQIAEENNITKAAEKLFITQSALNQQLLKLERELGTPLFQRTKNKWCLTDAGRIYVEGARKMIQIKKDTYNQLYDVSRLRKGLLNIGLCPGRGLDMFTAIYPELHRSMPNLTIRPLEMRVAPQQAAIAAGDLDVGVQVLSRSDWQKNQYEVLGSEELIAIIPAVHPVAQKAAPPGEPLATLDLNEIRYEPFVLMDRNSTLRSLCDQIFARSGFQPNVLFESNNTAGIVSLVKSTICCGIVPWYYTRIPSDELACFRLPGHPSWDITVSYPTTGYLSTGAREFIRLASEWWKTIQPDQI